MKLPVRFDENTGTIYDARNNQICFTMYSSGRIDQQKQDMRDIVEAVNRTEDLQDEENHEHDPS